MKILSQQDFPLLEDYSKIFKITPTTIFAYNNIIYSNDNNLSKDLIIHEETHFKQQEKYGLEQWVFNYLYNQHLRLDYEVEAYTNQINSIKDRNQKYITLITSAKILSSNLYGNIINYEQALKKLCR